MSDNESPGYTHNVLYRTMQMQGFTASNLAECMIKAKLWALENIVHEYDREIKRIIEFAPMNMPGTKASIVFNADLIPDGEEEGDT